MNSLYSNGNECSDNQIRFKVTPTRSDPPSPATTNQIIFENHMVLKIITSITYHAFYLWRHSSTHIKTSAKFQVDLLSNLKSRTRIILLHAQKLSSQESKALYTLNSSI